MRRAWIAIVLLLVILELVRRYALFADCLVTLRYDPRYAVLNPRAEIGQECFDRHVIFPFGFLR